MFKGRVWPALLCNASSSLPPWKPQTARRVVLARHPKARLELSHTHQGAPEKVLEAWRCSPEAAGKQCWASYKNTRHSSRKMLLSKATVTGSSPHDLALLLRELLPHLTRGDAKGGEPGQGLCHPEWYRHHVLTVTHGRDGEVSRRAGLSSCTSVLPRSSFPCLYL